MMDKNKWSQYAGTKYTDAFAIGGPTLELFIASWNSYSAHSSKQLSTSLSQFGYYTPSNASNLGDLGTTENMWVKDVSAAKAYGYWLSSPYYPGSGWSTNNVINVRYKGIIAGDDLPHSSFAFRPLVCIPKTSISN